MALLVQDTMTDTNGTNLSAHTPDTDSQGGGWSHISAGGTIQSNQFQAAGTFDGGLIDVGQADMRTTVDQNDGSANNRGLTIARADSTFNSGYYTTFKADLDDLEIGKNVTGTFTTLVFNNSVGLTSGTTYAYYTEVNGTALSAGWDDTEKLSTTDSSLTTGNYAGFRQNSNNGGAVWDNFEVDDLVAAVVNERTLDDTADVTDEQTRFLTLLKALTDNVVLIDLVGVARNLFRLVNNTAEVDDSISVSRALTRVFTDSVEITDDLEALFQVVISRILDDTTDLADSLTKSLRLLKTLTDNITVDDSLNVSRELYKTLTDEIVVTDDLIISIISKGVITRMLTDEVSAQDDILLSREFYKLVTDELGTTDELFLSRLLNRAIDDVSDITDDMMRSAYRNRFPEDSVSVSDLTDVERHVYREIAESIVVTSEILKQSHLFRLLIDEIGVEDEIIIEMIRRLHEIVLTDTLDVSDDLIRVIVQFVLNWGVIMTAASDLPIETKSEHLNIETGTRDSNTETDKEQ